MAFSSGFFNSKGLDRTYTAEDFCDYLGSMVCNGIQDRYGDCFKLTTSGLTVSLGTGKAWIEGHYFISNDKYTIDLGQYRDAEHPRYVSIGIVLDTGEAVRDVKIEVIPGQPADNPTIPDIPEGGSRHRLHLYAVHVAPEASSITQEDILDYRDDDRRCGYCKCILGKCGVTEMQAQIAELVNVIQDNNNRIDELTSIVEEMTEDVVEKGTCGDNINYVLFADGRLFLRGTGEMYDYNGSTQDPPNTSPFYNNQNIRKLSVSVGITSIGDHAFRYCDALESASFPNTLVSFGERSFYPTPDETIHPSKAYGLKTLIIPSHVAEIGAFAFSGTRLTSVTVPEHVISIGNYAFNRCVFLTTARIEAPTVGGFMFTSCTALTSVTLAKTVTKICSHWINYCTALTEIIYEGSLEDWGRIEKQSNWDGHQGQVKGTLEKIICTDGYMQYDPETNTWNEVRE